MSSAAATKLGTVVLVGAGPGLGAALARNFAEAGHNVAIAARSVEPLRSLADTINTNLASASPAQSDRVKAFSVDASSSSSVRELVEKASKAWGPDSRLSVGIWNPNAGFGIRPFQEWTEDQFRTALDVQVVGSFIFAQEMVKHFVAREPEQGTRGTLLFTGATAALRGSARMAGFSAAKAGLRNMAQSLAKEHGKDGVHVAHIIVDGLIETEHVSKMMGPAKTEYERLNTDAIANEYLHLSRQHASTWTQELDLRPAPEKW